MHHGRVRAWTLATIVAVAVSASFASGAAADLVVGPPVDLSTSVTGTPDPVYAGDEISYTITVTNNALTDAPDFTLSDTLPAGTSFVSLSKPDGFSCDTSGATVSCGAAAL